MPDNNKTKVHVVILFLFLLCVTIFSQSAEAAYVTTPSVEGLSGGTFKPLTTPALTGSNFVGTGKVLINGKLVPIPGYIPPASTAAQAARVSLFANPWVVGASLLLWPSSIGLEPDMSGWTLTLPAGEPAQGTGTAICNTPLSSGVGDTWSAACSDAISKWSYQCPTWDPATGNCIHGPVSYSGGKAIYYKDRYCTSASCVGGTTYGDLYAQNVYQDVTVGISGTETVPQPETRPATQADFDALPPPPVEALAELAPQVGVPVDDPVYEPADVSIGDPYTKPDGSTAEPRAKITPQSGGQVAIDTYDLPLTTPTGDPVTNPVPEDTTETPPTEHQCDKYPNTVGCTDLGIPPDGELMPHSEVALSFTPVAISQNATCPAPMTVGAFGQSIPVEYDAACTYASGLKPIVIAIAYLSALFIIFGVPRTGQS